MLKIITGEIFLCNDKVYQVEFSCYAVSESTEESSMFVFPYLIKSLITKLGSKQDVKDELEIVDEEEVRLVFRKFRLVTTEKFTSAGKQI